MLRLTSAFSSLGINEPSTSCQSGPLNRSKLTQNQNSVSLPDLGCCERPAISPAFIPVRNKYSDCVCEDETESADQPIDFSQKYAETKLMSDEPKAIKNGRNCTYNKVVKSYNNSFSMYAETDLDQPTDYSLRYAEDDSDSDDCSKISKSEATEFVQDTIKTYCTEDTPYETPFNFSTATSMSDLRIDDKAPIDAKLDEAKREDSDVKQPEPSSKIVKSEFSSGLMSPEKPVNYCDEGTPGYFSRVASFGSLNSIPVSDPPKAEPKETVEKSGDKEQKRAETKAVKFEEVVNYAEETPLMFSRSSSLASLDSIEQHSIHDDRSSVVSDFSRLTSGLVSPSELPDSPTQTVPPSPKPGKSPIQYPAPVKAKPTVELQTAVQAAPKASVFEDVVKKFKLESTPIQFSTATSLSSLTIDDHDEPDSKAGGRQKAQAEAAPTDEKSAESALIVNDDSSESSEDEDMLAACINIGMQNNRYSQQKSNSPPPGDVALPAYKFAHSPDLGAPSSRPTPRNSPQNLQPVAAIPSPAVAVVASGLPKVDATSDSLKTYCTEDTPAILSHAGSNSDLSILSIPGTESKIAKDYLSDINDDLSDDDNDDKLLEECIKSGMSKASRSNDVGTSQNGEIARASSEDNLDSLLLDKNGAGCSKMDDLREIAEGAIAEQAGGLNISLETNVSEDGQSRRSSFSSLSEESYENERALLQECILAGMPKTAKAAAPSNSFSDESNELTEAEQALLEQCIMEGMKKSRISARRPHGASADDSSELTEAEQALLKQCILEGMPKDKHLASGSRRSIELTDAEQALLEQCIQAGMPKSRQAGSSRPNGAGARAPSSRPTPRRPKEAEKGTQAEHTCCIHCPKNQQKQAQAVARQSSHVRAKRKPKAHERVQVQIRERSDLNILYMTSQILALKKELVDRSHEEWV